MSVSKSKVKSAAPLPVGGQLGVLQHRATLPEGTVCLAPLGSTAVAAGYHEGVKVVSWDSTASASASGFSVTCLASLGSQSLVAGDATGRVRIWHWRRGTLKLVHDIPVHTIAVRALANSGDVLFTAAEDGMVRRLEVLENFAPGDFSFSAGTVVSAVASAGKRSILVGCEDGNILEVHRKSSEVLHRFEFGSQLAVLDVNEEDGRVLAAGNDSLAVWRIPITSRDVGAAARARRRGDAVSSEFELVGTWSCPGIISALLLPGSRPEDVLVAGTRGLQRGGFDHPVEADAQADGPSGKPAAAMVRGTSTETALVAFLDAVSVDAKAVGRTSPVGRGSKAQLAVASLFEMELPKPLPESESRSCAGTGAGCDNANDRDSLQPPKEPDVSEKLEASAEDSKLEEASLVASSPCQDTSANSNERKDGATPNRGSLRTESRYWDPTEASRSRAA